MSKQAGFKYGVRTSKGYVFLSQNTKGQCGRKIFINGDLALKFKLLVEESQQDYIIHQLSQLRALAGTGSAYTSIQDPRVHKTKCGDLDVTYVIYQHKVRDISPGVYITDIDFGLFGAGNRPGTYLVLKSDNAWEVEEKSLEKIQTRNAAINGLTQGLRHAGQDMMPPMVEHAYGQQGKNRQALHNEGFTLFYNPQSIEIDGRKWKTPEQKQTNGKVVAEKLATQLKLSQKTGHEVQWTVHGNGCQVFQNALKLMPGQSLDRHTLMFMAPEGRLDQILPLARKAGMKLHDAVMRYSDHEASMSKFNNTVGYAKNVGAEVSAFGGTHVDKGAAIASHGMNVFHGSLLTAAYLGMSLGASLTKTALSHAIPTVLPEQRHMLRNRLASIARLNDDRINPHQNPHLSGADFNRKVMRKTGGMGQAYNITFKTLLKQIRG